MDYLEAQRFIKSHVCGECGGELSYIRVPGHLIEKYEIICPGNPTHESFERRKSPSEIWRQEGGQLPLVVANKIEKKEGKKMETRPIQIAEAMVGVVLPPEKREAIEKHLKTFDANLVGTEIEKALVLVGKGFDPYFHLCIYQKRIMVTCDGMHWWKNQAPESCRITSEAIKGEDRNAYDLAENEIGVIAKLYRGNEMEPACTGFGRASKDKDHPVQRGSFVEHEHPYRMAEKRAEVQVIRKFHPLGVEVPVPEEMGNGEAEETKTESTQASRGDA